MKQISLLLLLLVLACSSVWAQNKALSLDGDGDYIELEENNNALNLLGDKSIEVWINPTSFEENLGADQRILFKRIDTSGDNVYMLTLNGNQNNGWFVWSVYDDGIEYRADLSSLNYSANAWYRLTCTFDDSTKETKIYVNSKLKVEGKRSDGAWLRGNETKLELRLGVLNDNRGFFSGTLDEICIWDQVRTEVEIQASMKSTLTDWNFDDGTAKDLTVNGNDGEFKGDAKVVDSDLILGVSIPDPNLRAALEKALGKNEGDAITKEDLAGLKELVYEGKEGAKIADLTGLEHCTNLDVVELTKNVITDLSPLSSLTSLQVLILGENSIEDIRPIGKLTNLIWLKLYANQIENISALSGMTKLESLDLNGNLKIKDISPISQMTSLRAFSAVNNQIEDITPLRNLINLEHLDIWGNQISEISALAGLSNLTKLYLNVNKITDISPLSNLTSLNFLQLGSNHISDISTLSSLVNLTYLSVGSNKISEADLSVLTNLRNLTQLGIDGNQLTNISILSGLPNLTHLWIYGNKISDISVLSGLKNLVVLWLNGNQISDISPIVENTGISGEIKLKNNPLNNTAYTTQIPTLIKKGITVEYDEPPAGTVTFKDGNLEKAIRDALGIPTELLKKEDLAGLKELIVGNEGKPESEKISDLTGIEHCTSLSYQDLTNNEISDISVVSNLTKLKKIRFHNNKGY